MYNQETELHQHKSQRDTSKYSISNQARVTDSFNSRANGKWAKYCKVKFLIYNANKIKFYTN